MRGIGIDLSENLAAIVAASGNAVVRVEARGRGASTGVVWSEGVVVTADHTVEREENIQVGLADGRSLPATLAGREPAVDLAVLRVEGAGLVPAGWFETPEVQVGHLVLAVARPGRTTRAALGIVSALGDAWRTGAGGRVERYVQPDLGLFSGFSGSLLVDLEGRALGMNTSGLRRGIAMTLPVATLQRLTTEILEHGGTQRGFLGIGTMPVQLPQALAPAAGRASALLVVSVQPQSPADRAGMLLGDILVELGGKPVGQVGDLFEALDATPAGTATFARVLRGGVPREVQVTVGSRAA